MNRSDLPYPWRKMHVPSRRNLILPILVVYGMIGLLLSLSILFYRISPMMSLIAIGLILIVSILFGKEIHDTWMNGRYYPNFCVCALRPENYDEKDITFRIGSEFGDRIKIRPRSRVIRGMGKMRTIDLGGHRIHLYYRDYFFFRTASIYFGPVIDERDSAMLRRIDSLLYDVKFRKRDYQKIADDMMKGGA